MASQTPPVFKDLFAPDISQNVAEPTTLYDVRPRHNTLHDKVAQFSNTVRQVQNTGVAGAAVQSFLTRSPNMAVGTASLTIDEANKKYGMAIPGKPGERVSEVWALRQSKILQQTKEFEILSSNNKNAEGLTGLGIGFAGGVAASLTDPTEILLNIGTFGAVGVLGKGLLRASQAGTGLSRAYAAIAGTTRAATVPLSTPIATPFARAGAALAGKGIIREATEAAVSAGISTSANALNATTQDQAIYGPEGYTATNAAVDTATSAAATVALQLIGGGLGKAIGVGKSTLSNIISPQKAAVETVRAAEAGRPINPANTIDVPAVTQRVEVTQASMDQALRELAVAEKQVQQLPKTIPADTPQTELPRTPQRWPDSEEYGGTLFDYYDSNSRTDRAFQFRSDIDEALFLLGDTKNMSTEDVAKLRGLVASKTGLGSEQITALSGAVVEKLRNDLKQWGNIPDEVPTIWRDSFDIPDGPAPPEPPGYSARQSSEVFQQAFDAQEAAADAKTMLEDAEATAREVAGVEDIVEAQKKLGAEVLGAQRNIKALEATQAMLDQTKPEGAAQATEIQAQIDALREAAAPTEEAYRSLIEARRIADEFVNRPEVDYTKLEQSATHVDKPVYHPNSLKQKISVDGGRFNAPLDVMTVTSQFGMRHGHQHRGVDFSAPLGTPIKASRGGTVTKVGFQKGGAGNYVEVDHGGGYVTKYFHMNEIKVKKGQKVTSKDLVGTVGNTGRSTGPHLHFEVWKDGKAVDPEVWLNRKTAIADAPPASRDVPPVRLPEDSPIKVSPFDDLAMSAKNMGEVATRGSEIVNDLATRTANLAIEDKAEFPRGVIADTYEDLLDEMDVIAKYTNSEVYDKNLVRQAFEDGGKVARELISAAEKAPQAAVDILVRTLDNARSYLKDVEIRKAAEQGTKLQKGITAPTPDNLAKQAERQASIARELPKILAAHQLLTKLGHPRVTEELPIRYFMQMFGEDLSDFGKAIVGDFDPTNNQPLYRLRKQAVGRMLKEADGLRQLLGDIQKESGVKPYLSPEERTAQAAMAQVDETLKIAPPEDVKAFLEMAEQTKAEIDNIYQRYANTGLFDDASLRQMEGRAAEIKGKIDKGELSTPTDGGDKAKAAVTKLDNDKAYTAALEKVKDILFVCGARGLG